VGKHKLHLHNVGLGHRMYCSYGNECDLTMPEILEYYGQDPGTKAIMMQIESFKNPARFLEEGEELVDVAVDVPVGEETDQVQGGPLTGRGGQPLPGLRLKYLPGGDRLVDQLGSLGEDPPSPHGVVAHLAVSHIGIHAEEPCRL